jgi:hypothetical protein
MPICPACPGKPDLPDTSFYPANTARGVTAYCKECTKLKAKQRREEKAPEIKEYNKDYCAKNKKKIATQKRDWEGKNRAKRRKSNTEFKQKRRKELSTKKEAK